MRIGRDDNLLTIERVPLEGGWSAFKIEAVANAAGVRFSASHDRLLIDSSAEGLRLFGDFAELKSNEFEASLTEGSTLRFTRDVKGYITVQYRIASYKTRGAIEGHVVVEGEFAGGFCREFGALVNADVAQTPPKSISSQSNS